MLTDAIVNRRRPTPVTDGLSGASNDRRSPYGDLVAYQTPRNALADEGSYYTVNNPTIDTTVAYGVIAAYVVTTPMFLIVNTAPVGGRSIFLDYVTARVTVAPASATNWKYVVDLDTSQRLSTAPTGGVNRTAGVNNVNPSMPNDFEGQVWAFSGGTVLTVMAASSLRTVAHGPIAHSIPLVLDELTIAFGQGQGMSAPATAVTRRIGHAPPIVIPPGCSAAIHEYGTGNAITGMSLEYSIGLWQR